MRIQQRSVLTRFSYALGGFLAVLLGVYVSSGKAQVPEQAAEALQPSPPSQEDPALGTTTSPQGTDANSGLVPVTKLQGVQTESKSTDTSFESVPESKQPIFDTSGDYRYEPVGKRDPFRPYRDAKIGIGLVRALARPQEPLEKYDLKTLEVVAIVWGNEKPKALIQDPDKQVHSVVKGQRIGKNEGFIAEIREGEIVVVELFDLNGKVIKESVVLPIKK